MQGFKRQEIFFKRGQNFTVEVKRYEEQQAELAAFGTGPHRFNVYAHIFSGHPAFSTFDPKGGMFQDAATALPLHGGPSYFDAAYDSEGKPIRYTVGSDYNHLGDEHFTWREEMPAQVEADAILLYLHLSTKQENDNA